MLGQEQLDFSFEAAPNSTEADPVNEWRKQCREELSRIAASLGLPIGQRVRVTLHNGILVEGRLILCEGEGFRGAKRSNDPPLRIGNVDFYWREVESSVALE